MILNSSKLLHYAHKGQSHLFIGQNLKFKNGDEILIKSENADFSLEEFAKVDSYDAISGELYLDSPLCGSHFGDLDPTI